MKKLLTSILLIASPIFARNKPNIVLIMADDLGYECLAVNGADDYKTPVLDKMAKEGVRFTNCFANPICTPSRVKIMTGMYNVRNYTKFAQLDRSQKTFAHEFKKAGYATCIAGKWQLGKQEDSPQHFGFDQSCLWQHLRKRVKKGGFDSRYPNPALEINGVAKDYENGEYSSDVCTDFVLDFIEEHKEKPFLVYYPMILTHCPFSATPDSEEWDPKSPGVKGYSGDAKYFGDMVTYMDKCVGRILNTLDELKLRDNTLVLFTGDNGTDLPVKTQMSGRTIAGGKGSMTDNGTRVPLIARWPGQIKQGLVSDELVDFSDFLPTMCEAAALPVPTNRPIDGVSFLSTLKGDKTRQKPWIYIWHKTTGQGRFQMVRTKTDILTAKGDLSEMKFSVSNRPYETTEIADAEMTDDQKESRAMLEKIMQDMVKTRPAELDAKKKGSAPESKKNGKGE